MSLALAKRPDPPPETAPATLTKQQKAAILLSVLIRANAAPNLDNIATAALKQTVDTMATFGDVPQATVDTVILEFLTELGAFGVSLRGLSLIHI